MTNRRKFLGQAAAAAGAGLLSGMPARRMWALSPNMMLPPVDEARLRALALVAVDAARAAGATFADVRVATSRSASVGCSGAPGKSGQMSPPTVALNAGYSVRALIGGAWGGASGYDLTPDAVTRAAQAAALRAKANRPRFRSTLDLAPLPKVESGSWTTPIEEDPFAQTFSHQGDLLLAAIAEASKVAGVVSAGGGMSWTRADQVFAATDGTVQYQTLYRASPYAYTTAMVGSDDYTRADAGTKSLRSGGYGFEAVARVDLVAELREAAERAVAESKTLKPPQPFEIGRFDVVFAGSWFPAYLMLETLGRATELDRALGYQANQAGTSFAAPPEDVIGKMKVASPLVTIHAERSMPGGWATVGWDDEGVKPEPYTMVKEGVLTDFHTSRQTAPALASWYRSRGEAVRSHGCAMGLGQALPEVGIPNLTMEPGAPGVTEADLIAGVKRGLYVTGGSGSTDQQVLSGQYSLDYRTVREIRNGQLGPRLADVAFQFVTPTLWKKLDALGGPDTARTTRLGNLAMGSWWEPMQLRESSVRFVPMRVRQMNILNVGRTA